MTPDTRIAVVGAGIAGLAVALAATQQRCKVTLIDNSTAELSGGSVLLLWPNGMKAARALGVAREIRRKGTVVRRTEFKLWSGSRLWELDVDGFEWKHGEGAVLIARADLIAVLSEAFPALSSRVSAKCTGFAVFGESIAPILKSTSAGPVLPNPPPTGLFDALIGCDGLRSSIRRQLRWEDQIPRSAHRSPVKGKFDPPRSAYHSAWIGLSDVTKQQWDYDVGHTVTFLGHGLRLCASTMKEAGATTGTRRVYWYATESVSEFEEEGFELRPGQLVELFATVSRSAANLIEASIDNPTLKPTRFHIQDRIPVRRWSWGRVTLAGDAAHPSTPDLGQGACQALESAAVLGRCLEDTDDIEKAFARYERLRLERTARVTEMSRLTAIQSMTRGPLVESVRELGIRTLLPTITEREFDSLFSFEI